MSSNDLPKPVGRLVINLSPAIHILMDLNVCIRELSKAPTSVNAIEVPRKSYQLDIQASGVLLMILVSLCFDPSST